MAVEATKEADMADEDTNAPDTDAPKDDAPNDATPDLKAELAKWKSMARKHEAESKANAGAAKKLADIEDANRSELEKILRRAEEAEAKVTAAEERAVKASMKAAVVAAATRAGAVDPDAVFQLLGTDAITIDGDSVKGADDAVKALLTAKPYLVGKPAKPAGGSADGGKQGDRPTQWTKADLKGKSSAEIEAARRAGLLNALMNPS